MPPGGRSTTTEASPQSTILPRLIRYSRRPESVKRRAGLTPL